MKLHYKIVFFCIGICGLGMVYFAHKRHADKKDIRFRVAIVQPASHPAMDEIAAGFMDTINKEYSGYHFDIYNANGNSTLLRAQAEEIVHNNYDLVTTIGSDATRTLHELTRKKNSTMPIVFSAVSDPVGLGVVNSIESSQNNVTGVEDSPRFEEQIKQLLELKPHAKSVLLVYDPAIKSGAHERNVTEVETIFTRNGIKVNHAPIFHANEVQAKVQPLLNNNDVIMIFTDHTAVSGLDSLVMLANRYHLTLYASDLNSGDRGAALAYGIKEYEYGVESAQLAMRILEKHDKPADIPIISVRNYTIKVNTKTMQQQGLELSSQKLQKIEQQGGIII
jgi:putative ABC transport system substrate-binding protein